MTNRPLSPLIDTMGRYENLNASISRNRDHAVNAANRANQARDPRERLSNAAALGAAAVWILDDVVAQCHLSGMSWEQIAGIVGISRQAAHKRWATYVARAGVPPATDTQKTVTE